MILRRFCPILLACASIGLAANAQPAPALFAPVGGPVPPGLAAVASQRVEPDLELLAAAPAELRLDLPDAPPLFARLSALESRGPGDLTWRGTLLDEPGGGVTLTLKNGYVVGLVTTSSAVWEIRTLPDGGQSVDRIEQDRFPACGTPQAPGPAARLGDLDPCPDPENGDRADVLSMYTPQARDAVGGVPQIEALIQAAVDNSNTAFINSEMPLRFYLAGTALADHDDTGNSSTDLTWLINDSVTAALRNELSADLVSLITEDGGGFCGIGQLPLTWGPGGNPGSVHQVTARGCAVGNLTYAHEHGHNMGLEHDPANANPPGSGTYPYRYGHFVSGSYRTVMSYSNQCSGGCPRVTQWSNPDVSFMGQPTGITDERDNRRASGLSDGCVVDYRIGGLFADGFESGDASAWSSTVP